MLQQAYKFSDIVLLRKIISISYTAGVKEIWAGVVWSPALTEAVGKREKHWPLIYYWKQRLKEIIFQTKWSVHNINNNYFTYTKSPKLQFFAPLIPEAGEELNLRKRDSLGQINKQVESRSGIASLKKDPLVMFNLARKWNQFNKKLFLNCTRWQSVSVKRSDLSIWIILNVHHCFLFLLPHACYFIEAIE